MHKRAIGTTGWQGNAAAQQRIRRRRGIGTRNVIVMDTDMAGGGGDSTENRKRSRSAAQQGATEVGQGLPVVVPRNIPHGYNNNFTVCLSYGDSRLISINMAGGYDIRTWSANGIYDPDITATGHQPMLRDLWASQYDYYTVLACHYHIEVYNCSNDNIGWTVVGTNLQRVSGCIVTLIPTTNTSDITNAATGLISTAG